MLQRIVVDISGEKSKRCPENQLKRYFESGGIPLTDESRRRHARGVDLYPFYPAKGSWARRVRRSFEVACEEGLPRVKERHAVSDLRSEVNIELNFPPKLRGARSRLYRRRFCK